METTTLRSTKETELLTIGIKQFNI